ncbi:MAG: hybrid sensor histidine kinase/response regulator [Pyrinomonadaceae bacterium]|nr:hybrid sensor histidine kinase/response regulator [Pyrinomonadaceae bacterium]
MQSSPERKENRSRRIYQATITAAGLLVWLVAAGETFTGHAWRDLSFLLPAIPLIMIVGMFPLTFLLRKSAQENVTFTLIDAFVLAIAGWYGIGPAVLIAGIEAFTSSRRQVHKLSSNLFSGAIMSIAAAAASVCLSGLMGNGWTGAAITDHRSISAVAIALLVASIVQLTVNWGLLSSLLAMRHDNSILLLWKQDFWRALPMFLPTSVAASLVFFGVQNGAIATMAICGPVLLAVYFGHNQNRVRAEQAEAAERARAEEAERHVAELSQYIAEQGRILEKFSQIEKLSAIGELASGVAHDFNNTLSGILGRAQLLHAHSSDAKEVERGLDIIIKTAKDGAHTVKRIQDFARQKRDRDFELIAVDQLLSDVSEITRPRWKNRAGAASVYINLDVCVTTKAMVMGDPSELREVLVNIVFNAIDALPVGGKITLSASESDGQVEIRVTDSGTGMTDEVRSHIFDPFFTTKGKAGMGLGLAVSYGIVCRHEGRLEVESEVGRGTSFVIKLAVANQSAPAQSSENSVQAVALANQVAVRVLVVDDEDYVRELLRDILESLGHQVVEAEDGFKAIELFDSQVFDAVFTDISMTGMSGWELARLIRERNSELPLAILSGWGEPISADEQWAAKVNWIVAKPFLIERIAEVVKEISERHLEGSKTPRRKLSLVA